MRTLSRIRRFLFAGVAVSTLLAASGAPAAAQTAQDPISVLEQFIASVNRNDPAQIQASFFTDDAIFIGGPCGDLPSNTCVGKAQIQQEIASGGAVQVTLNPAPTLTGEGNVVQLRTEERFDLPPQATSAGIQRYVETGQAVIANGKIQRIALVADVTDPQTVSLIRLFSSMGPPPGSQPGALVANDGQSLATQPIEVQLEFIRIWGNQAATEWVKEHNASMGGGR